MQASKPKGIQIMTEEAAATPGTQKRKGDSTVYPGARVMEHPHSDKLPRARKAKTYQSMAEWRSRPCLT